MEARVGRINAVLSGAVNVATAAAADSGCEGGAPSLDSAPDSIDSIDADFSGQSLSKGLPLHRWAVLVQDWRM